MKAYLSRAYRLSASHRLHAEDLSVEENQAVFGKCNNPHGHGHNYRIEVTFSGSVDPVTGMIADLGALDRFAQTHLLDRFDVNNLNTLPEFAACVPTSENFSVEVYRIFSRFPHAHLERVHVQETGNNSFDYAGPELPAAGRY